MSEWRCKECRRGYDPELSFYNDVQMCPVCGDLFYDWQEVMTHTAPGDRISFNQWRKQELAD